MKTHSNFAASFIKTATSRLPSWAKKLHITMEPRESMPGYSKRGIKQMWKRRGLKDGK